MFDFTSFCDGFHRFDWLVLIFMWELLTSSFLLASQVAQQGANLSSQMANLTVTPNRRLVSNTLTPVQTKRKAANAEFAQFLISIASDKQNVQFSTLQAAVDTFTLAYGSMVSSLAFNILAKIRDEIGISDNSGKPLTALSIVVPQLAFLLVHPDESPGLQYRLKQILLDNHAANSFFHVY